MNKPKIGFHVAANCGGCNGIDAYWKALNDAAIPFTVYSANDAGIITQAARYPHAQLIYRDVEASTVNPADYARDPALAAVEYWTRTKDRLPVAIREWKYRVWIELLNEPGREDAQANWVGWLMFHMATLAIREGYRVMGAGWAPGNPEPQAWLSTGWQAYLRLCAAERGRVAVSLHEYSLDNDITAGWGWLIGRFDHLIRACDALGIARPDIFITECGWTLNSMPPDEQAKQDIQDLALLYSGPEIKSVHLWTLQAGAGNGDLPQRLNALIPWLTEFTLNTTFPDVDLPDDPDNPMSTQLLINPSFEDGWNDADTFPGQHPNGWTVEWNAGATFDNPHSEWEYQLGEGVHKSKAMLPAAERDVFVWDGEWTYKLFAGNRCFWARLKQTVNVPAGRYRLAVPVWVDCYRWAGYKDYAVEPWQAEYMVKANGKDARAWSLMVSGAKSPNVTEFDHTGGPLALAVHFRCNWPISNNLWLDGWSLAAIGVEPPPVEPPPVKHKAIVLKVPQDVTAEEWQAAAAYGFQYRHTMTASHDDMMTILYGGNADSYVKLAWPDRQSGIPALVEGAGYSWVPLFDEPLTLAYWPVKAAPVVTQVFGVRPEYYAQYGLPGHEGVDMKAPLNTPILAAAAGTVIERATGTNYGHYIRLSHAGGWRTVYAHLNQFANEQVGDIVAAGQTIGFAGTTGNSDGVHLHFGVNHETKEYTDAQGNRWPKGIHDPTPFLAQWITDTPPVTTIDLLHYIRGDGRIYRMTVMWKGAKHTQQMQTQAGASRFYLVKNHEWEELFSDDTTIYRGIDTSPGDGMYYWQRQNPLENKAKWCPRHWSVGDVYERNPLVTFYDKVTGNKLDTPPTGYRRTWLKFAARHTTWKAAQGLTFTDVVELHWLPQENGTPAEWYYYAAGLGLVGWRSSSGDYSYVTDVYQPGVGEPMARENIAIK